MKVILAMVAGVGLMAVAFNVLENARNEQPLEKIRTRMNGVPVDMLAKMEYIRANGSRTITPAELKEVR